MTTRKKLEFKMINLFTIEHVYISQTIRYGPQESPQQDNGVERRPNPVAVMDRASH